MERRLVLRYTPLLINYYRQTNGDNAVCRPTVNLAYRRLLPLILQEFIKYNKEQKNEGKWEEARYRQMKQWLIILDRIPEEKE